LRRKYGNYSTSWVGCGGVVMEGGQLSGNGDRVATWQLECVHCKKKFRHSEVDETRLDIFSPAKPEFPQGGSEIECPHCGKTATYQRYQLTYQG
jgi:DNA-directed RNA polymerase subunit RPC12/RpoP